MDKQQGPGTALCFGHEVAAGGCDMGLSLPEPAPAGTGQCSSVASDLFHIQAKGQLTAGQSHVGCVGRGTSVAFTSLLVS